MSQLHLPHWIHHPSEMHWPSWPAFMRQGARTRSSGAVAPWKLTMLAFAVVVALAVAAASLLVVMRGDDLPLVADMPMAVADAAPMPVVDEFELAKQAATIEELPPQF